jgi:hypothetical protein
MVVQAPVVWVPGLAPVAEPVTIPIYQWEQIHRVVPAVNNKSCR